MLNDWQSHNKFLDSKIKSYIHSSNTIFVKVVSTDGFYVNVLPFTEAIGFEVVENVPILQSKYFSPIVQVDDVGLLLDIKLNLSPFFENNKNMKLSRQTYYIFLPFNLIDEFQSNADSFQIKSADLQTNLSITNGNISLNSTDAINLKAENTSINSNSSLNLQSSNISAKSSGVLSLKGAGDPIEVGNDSGTLGKVVDELVKMMDALSSGMKGQQTEPSAYQASKSASIQNIKKIIS